MRGRPRECRSRSLCHPPQPRHAFAKNKPPYKTDFFISLGLGELQATASYFVHIEPCHCYAGGGIFTTQPDALGHIRDRIVAQTGHWNGIVHTPTFKQVFPNGLTSPDTLKSAPHGYDPRRRSPASTRILARISPSSGP